MTRHVWITRDLAEDGSGLMPYVSLWDVRPKRWALGAGFIWLSEGFDLVGFLGSLWLMDAYRLVGTTPDDDRQVIVAERDPDRVRAFIDDLIRLNGRR
jgi:hypothetical protein